MSNVSVITPVYNTERFLRKCLDSLLQQTWKDIEFICVNDGSTDNSPEILAEYAKKDARFRVIHQENGGYGKAMNAGLKAATGKYIGIVESDDFVTPEMFERLVELAEVHDADIIKGNHFEYAELYTEKIELYSADECGRVLCPRKDLPSVFCRTPSIWTGLYKRRFLQENGIVFHETPGAAFQDNSFYFKCMACAEKVLFSQEAFLFYRISNSGSSIHSHGHVDAMFDEMEEANRFLSERPELERGLRYVMPAYRAGQHWWNYIRIGLSHKFSYLERVLASMEKLPIGVFSEPYLWPYSEIRTFWMNLLYHREQTIFTEVVIWQRLSMFLQGFHVLLHKTSGIYVFGAGKVGTEVCTFLLKRNLKVNGVVVTQKEGNPKDVLGIPVIALEEMDASVRDRCLMLPAVQDGRQYEVCQMLYQQGFEYVFPMTNEIRKQMFPPIKIFG